MTKEERSAFFAQYWGQICKDKFGSINIWNGLFDISDYYLELKSLANISDEDAVEFFDIVWGNVANHKDKPREFKIDFGKEWALSPTSTRYGLIPKGLFHGVDYLRSKSYALPFRQYSVEELVKGGVIKLI